jgi:hypothetical protein
MTPITDNQRNQARSLLLSAERALKTLTEERLNLDMQTRDAADRELDAIGAAYYALIEQPTATWK